MFYILLQVWQWCETLGLCLENITYWESVIVQSTGSLLSDVIF
jgi:hypothetical protein